MVDKSIIGKNLSEAANAVKSIFSKESEAEWPHEDTSSISESNLSSTGAREAIIVPDNADSS